MGEPKMLRAEIRDFLITRRARVSPREAGLTGEALNRKVDGLRREEVAELAGISVEYYTRIERGQAPGASPSIIRSLTHVLQLNDAERNHLRHLLTALGAGECGTIGADATPVRPQIRLMVDAFADFPAFVTNRYFDSSSRTNSLRPSMRHSSTPPAAPPSTLPDSTSTPRMWPATSGPTGT